MEFPVVVPAQALERGEVVSEPLKLLVHHREGLAETLSEWEREQNRSMTGSLFMNAGAYEGYTTAPNGIV